MGVNGKGTVMRAHNATNKLAPTTSATCRKASGTRACSALNVCVAGLDMGESPNLSTRTIHQRAIQIFSNLGSWLDAAGLGLGHARAFSQELRLAQIAPQAQIQGDRNAHNHER